MTGEGKCRVSGRLTSTQYASNLGTGKKGRHCNGHAKSDPPCSHRLDPLPPYPLRTGDSAPAR